MLEFRGITKEYKTGAEVVRALRGVDLTFRKSEFVAILGPSGCGKTTMLNILGGLDRYTEGDLIINDVSTKEYKAADWDAYRNNTIGFVFQSYNLISHQNVLRNVELALTLSGVGRTERRRRAVEALEQVGLGDQLYKKPAQMSGGQVQRVAIARALINDPDIILADEPTGALDTETGTQVMEVLKNISTRKLVIMVTHNPELAEKYSTRIVRLSDGLIVSDSNPVTKASIPSGSLNLKNEARGTVPSVPSARKRNRSMSPLTSLSLSLNNLMTKKARTLLTAFAGSIGIIGIALILSVSNGFQKYIDKLEEDTLSSYPLTIQSETADMSSMISAFMSNAQDTKGEDSGGLVHEQQIMTDMLASVGSNDLAAFRHHIESNIDEINGWFNAYEYKYGLSAHIYSTDMKYGPLRVSPGSIMQSYMSGLQQSSFSMMNSDVFFQMMDNEALLRSQYKILAGEWPRKYNELLLVLDSEDQLNDYIVYTLGLRDPQELKDMINDVMEGRDVVNTNRQLEWSYDDFIGKEFALVHSCDIYKKNSSYDVWEDMSEDDEYMEALIKSSEKLHISGIVCANDNSASNAMSSGIGYLSSLTSHMIDHAGKSEIVKIQLANKKTDVFSGKTFDEIHNNSGSELGFEDMISIDEDKLRSALGGDIDPDAVQEDIMKIGNDEIKALSDADSAEKIAADVSDALTRGCESIIAELRKQHDKNPEKFEINNETVDLALGASLDKGSHAQIVNPLLQGYAALLKQTSSDIQKNASPEALLIQGAEAANIKLSAEDAKALLELAEAGDEKAVAEAISERIGVTDPSVTAALTDAIKNTEAASVEALFTALGATVEPYVSSEEIKSGIEQYAKGLEQMGYAEHVYPALGQAAEAIGSRMKVDPDGIADAFTMKMDEEELTRLITAYASGGSETNYESNLRKLGYADVSKPTSISFYLKDFDSKESFLQFIEAYNQEKKESGDEDLVISYTDITGALIKSVKTITNAVSYVLIAFVAISLIVSSIMIGVITYISVLERTKEIGILRAIGASKRDIAGIFNAETLIVGLTAGVIGILASLVLLIPINKILLNLTKVAALRAVLPMRGALSLIIISMVLTVVSGLIPSGMAARKDPVEALRTD